MNIALSARRATTLFSRPAPRCLAIQQRYHRPNTVPLTGTSPYATATINPARPATSSTSTSTASTSSTGSPATMDPQMNTTPPTRTLSLPRILCLHGGGVNAAIFRSQMRALLTHPSLTTRYRFVFVDAPFICAEGVGVVPVYEKWAPFRRWFRWLASHEKVSDVGSAHGQLWEAVEEGMRRDEGTGEWVGLVGFSQGAKLVCSLLYEQQLRADRGEAPKEGEAQWQFGVVLAGRCPFAALSEEGEGLSWLQSAGGLPSEADMEAIRERPDMKLRVPTLHVHGLRDEGLELHRRAVEDYCAPGTTSVVEWDGPHRVPIKKADVEAVVGAFVELVDEYGL